MKVTAIIPDQVVDEVRYYAKGKNLTDKKLLAVTPDELGFKRQTA